MNAKANRQVVVAKYSDNFVYKVPKGIDIEDRTQVKQYWIKWNRLHIEMINGEEIIIDTECDMEMKYPDEMRVEDYDEYYDDETESESEEITDEMIAEKIDTLIEKCEDNMLKKKIIDNVIDKVIEIVEKLPEETMINFPVELMNETGNCCEECNNEIKKLSRELLRLLNISPKANKSFIEKYGNKIRLTNADDIRERIQFILNYNMDNYEDSDTESEDEITDEMIELEKLGKEMLRLLDISPKAVPSFIEKFSKDPYDDDCFESVEMLRERIEFILNYNMDNYEEK